MPCAIFGTFGGSKSGKVPVAYNEEELEQIESKKKQYSINRKINKKESDDKFKQDLEDNGPRRSKRLNTSPPVQQEVELRRSSGIKELQKGN